MNIKNEILYILLKYEEEDLHHIYKSNYDKVIEEIKDLYLKLFDEFNIKEYLVSHGITQPLDINNTELLLIAFYKYLLEE